MSHDEKEEKAKKTCHLSGGRCLCIAGRCEKFGSIANRVKVPGHPEFSGFLRAFPERK